MRLQPNYLPLFIKMLCIALLCTPALGVSAQCNQNYIYGLTNVGMIQQIDVTNGSVAAPMNPAFGGNAPNLSNAMGYNPLNGKYYFFKRNAFSAPQEFMSFDPATNLYAMLAASPVGAGNIVNLGCVNSTGLGYYCLDAFGVLYYYSVTLNTWTTICSNIKNQSGTTLSSIIGAGSLNRYYGDLAFDGQGNLWILISGAVDYGLYKITGPLPISNVANLTATQIIAPNTASPAGTFGGMAFSGTGAMYLSSNSPSNKLYRLSAVNTLTFLTNLGVDGIGNDLTSCNFPLAVLPVVWESFTAESNDKHNALLRWRVSIQTDHNGYYIEHSRDGLSWEDIGFTGYSGANASGQYSFTHTSMTGGQHYYRIREISPGGQLSYSETKVITLSNGNAVDIWPNPTRNVIHIQHENSGTGSSTALLFDQSGRQVHAGPLQPGLNTIAINTLPPGIYIMRIQGSNGDVYNEKVLKQ